MRFELSCAVAVVLSSASASCGASLATTNSGKLGEALAFAAAAGALQVAHAAVEQHARNSRPVASSGPFAPCDNEDQYACVSVAPPPASPAPPDQEMTADEARDYVLGYVNGVRKLNDTGPLVRDDALDAFAQTGSEELAQDHLAGQHIAQHAPELHVASGEIQGPSQGSPPGLLQDRIAEVLLGVTNEQRGGSQRATMLRTDWRTIGVGIAVHDRRLYLTLDFSD